MVMEKYKGRVALVTGASAGIGAAIVQALLREGLTVVGMARRVEQVKALELKDAPGKLHAIAGDVSDESSILSVFKWIKTNLGGVDVLVNNAGVFPPNEPTDGKTEAWKRILDVNVLGLSICTREAVQDMLSRKVDDGFIIHVNSVAGHTPPFVSAIAMYTASKHAVKILLEGLRKDLVAKGSNIRVGEVSPGLVDTEGVRKVMPNSSLSKELKSSPALQPEDIADAVVYMLSRHQRVQNPQSTCDSPPQKRQKVTGQTQMDRIPEERKNYKKQRMEMEKERQQKRDLIEQEKLKIKRAKVNAIIEQNKHLAEISLNLRRLLDRMSYNPFH